MRRLGRPSQQRCSIRTRHTVLCASNHHLLLEDSTPPSSYHPLPLSCRPPLQHLRLVKDTPTLDWWSWRR